MKKLILSILFIGFVLVSFGQNLKGYNIESLHKLEAKRAFVVDLDTFYATTQVSSIDTTLATKGYVSTFLEDSIIRIQMPDSTGQFPTWNQDSGFFETTKYIQDYQVNSDTLNWDATKSDLIDGLSTKQNTLTNPVTGTGTTNYVSKWTGTTTQGNSQIFDNGTNVAIGHSSPVRTLDIQAATATTQIKSTTGTNHAFMVVNNTGGNLYIGRERSIGGSILPGSSAYSSVIASLGIYPIQFGVNNAIAMTILNGGNTGIGITSPAEKLEVNGNIKAITGKFTGLNDAFFPIHTSDAVGLQNSNVFQTSSKLRYNTTLTTFDNDNDIPNVGWVNSIATGNSPKLPVDAATTANITLSGTQTIDGYAVTAGMRVLVKDQSTASQNGVYVVAAGSWSRSTDLDSWSELYKAYVAVLNGTISSGSSYVCTVPVSGTLGTDAVTWILYNAPSNILVNSPLSKSGNTISLGYDTNTLDVASGNLKVKDNVFQPLSTILTNTTATYTDADSIKLAGLITNAVPDTRSITINGTSQDLSADRTYNVGTVTSVATGLGMTGGPITTSGTVSLDTASTVVLSRQRAANEYQPKGSYISSETDPIFAADSSKLVHWSDTLSSTKGIASSYNIRNIKGLNTITNAFIPIKTAFGYFNSPISSLGNEIYLSGNISVPTDYGNFKLQITGSTYGTEQFYSSQDGTTDSSLVRLSQINTLLSGYEPEITAGTTAQYWRGDKTFQTLNTTAVTEGTNLYFTNARSRTSISETITGIDYNNTTGNFSITSGYAIPTTTNQTNWNTAYGWGNHATAGYLTSETDPVYSASSWFSTTNNSTNWNTAYTDRNKWDGGSTGLNAATGRTSLGATTIGSNIFTSTNPSAIRFLRANADNSVSWLTASEFVTAIGAGTSSGTVSNVATGLGLTGGPITTTGTISLDTANVSVLSRQRAANTYQVKGSYLTDDSNYAKLNAANIFTANQNISKTTPVFNIKSTDATARKIEFLNSSGVGVGNITSNIDGSLDIKGSTDIELNAGSGNNFRITETNHFIEGLNSGTQTKIIGYNTTTGEINYQDPPGDSGYAKLNIANTFTAKQTTSFSSSANYVSEIYNTNALGNGLLVQTSALGTQPIFNAQTAAVNDLFRVNADGTIKMGNLPLSTKNYIIGYDPTTKYISYQAAPPTYTAGTGLQLVSDEFSFNINGMNTIAGASIVDGDYIPIYHASTSSHYKLSMSGLKTYLALPLAANGTRGGIQIGYTSTANNFALNLSSEKAYTALPDASTTVKGIASFNTANFSTSTGAVNIKSGGVTATNLNSNVISGQTDIGTNIIDSDIFLISDGSVIRKTAASRLKTYIGASGSLWTDAGTYTYLTSTTDKLNIGYSTDASAAKLAVNGNADINGSIQSVVSYTDTWYSAGYGLESNELSAKPSTPSSGTGQFYAKNDNKPYFQNDSGTEYDLTGLVMPLRAITSATTLLSTDYTVMLGTGSSITSYGTQPTGKIFILRNKTANSISVPNYMPRSQSAVVNSVNGYDSVTIQYDGTTWYQIN